MRRGSIMRKLRPIKEEIGDYYRRSFIDRNIPSIPAEATVPLHATSEILLLCSPFVPRFDSQTYIQELAFAHEMAARNRPFAVTGDPSLLVEKSVAWFLPSQFVSPRLWDYSRQVYEFAAGLERQGNRLFRSSRETIYWENKAAMHRELCEVGAPTPATKILTAENWKLVDFDIEPTLIKEEHSAGSSGIHYFATAGEAFAFVKRYPFRPEESLIMQEVVRGATKDLRLTIVGERMVVGATYWRKKSPEAISAQEWTTTATTYNSDVEHANIPESVVPFAAGYLRKLGVRTAGIDLMWADDDVTRDPLILEFSPYYQPNPPKPERYRHLTYKQYKARPYTADGYILQQYVVFREIIRQILEQDLY
jgi:hypothetical protein